MAKKNCNNANDSKSSRNHNTRGRKRNYSSNKPNSKSGYDKRAAEEAATSQDYAKEQAVSNDPAWYASDPSLARDSASIPFSWAAGTISNLRESAPVYTDLNEYQFITPGLCTIWLRSSVGASDAPTSPINIAATAMYSFVRHANSGSANYNSPDLMLYVIGMAEIIAFSNFLIRAYGVASLYSTRNRYLPDALLQSMNIDPDDVRANYAQFRYGINLAMNKISSLAVPSTLSYFKRKAMLYSGVYIEGSSPKDQMYMYAPFALYQLGADADGATAAYLKQFRNPTKLYTVAELLQFLNDLIDPIIMSEDFNIMSGDILKAYGLSGILKFARVDENYVAPLGFDIGVLEQMKNAYILTGLEHIGPETGSIVQNNSSGVNAKGWLVSKEQITLPTISPTTGAGARAEYAGIISGAKKRILVTTTKDVDPGLVLESTRLMPGAAYIPPTSGSDPGSIVIYGATELPTSFVITSMEQESGVPTLEFRSNATAIVSVGGVSAANHSNIETLAMLAAFNFAPNVEFDFVSTTTGESVSIDETFRFYRFDNYAILTTEDLQRMHEACLLNMMRVPSIGSVFS
nr:capsid protein [Rat picobirnavirus]